MSDTTKTETKLQWVGVLAGAYKGSTKKFLNHVEVRGGLKVGRITRGQFDVLCRTVDADSLCDEGSKGTERCPACLALVERHGLQVEEEAGPAASGL